MKYSEFVDVYQKLDSTTKRLEKTYFIAKLIKKTKQEDIPTIILLLQGKVFEAWDERKLGVATRMVIKAINVATGISPKIIEDEWKNIGDLGEVTEKLTGKKTQATLFTNELTVKKVFNNLQKIASLEGEGSVDRKIQLLAELLTSAKPIEARYITRTVLEDLRVGTGAGTLRDAIVWAEFPKIQKIFFKCDKCHKVNPKIKKCLECDNDLDLKSKLEGKNEHLGEDYKHINIQKVDVLTFEKEEQAREAYKYYSDLVQDAYNLTNDFGKVVLTAKTKGIKGLEEIDITPFKPIKVMLYQKAKDIDDAFERVGAPAAFEFKYDGLRIQAHKIDGKITLFTRNFEDVTKQFPDLVNAVKNHVKSDSIILDGEAVGFDKTTTQYLPFQMISQRIKRKYNIEELADKFPVEYNVFDVLYYKGKNVLCEKFMERRGIISKVIDATDRVIVPSMIIVTDKKDEASKFYQEALDVGNEGIMAKNLEAIYKPGSRVGFGVKIKPVMESLDLVVVGAEWGTGKRAKWLTSFIIACMDDEGNLQQLGKVSTGLKELEDEGTTYSQMTEFLKPLVISEKGKVVEVKPKIVIEVNYEEIQKSPTYASGYALRFPRFIRLREDRGINDCSSLDQVEDLFDMQRGRG
jgi:ATP-dependent DNA ligase I